MLGTIHIVFAITALVVGAGMFLQKKGDRRHRYFGYLYCIALLALNLSALSVYRDSEGPGPFHILAFISLATLAAGILPRLLRKPMHAWVSHHAHFMSWSYVGLVAAGIGQMATKFSTLPAVIAVGVPSIIVVLVGGLLIHTRVSVAVASYKSK